MKKNNVDLDRLQATFSDVQKDLSKAKKVNKIEGEWNLGQGAQFRATVSFENGKMTLEADQPGFLGGGGTQPISPAPLVPIPDTSRPAEAEDAYPVERLRSQRRRDGSAGRETR